MNLIKLQCECGCTIKKRSMYNHLKTDKHKNAMQSIQLAQFRDELIKSNNEMTNLNNIFQEITNQYTQLMNKLSQS